MKFSILHRTTFKYDSPVADSINDVHLCPSSDDFQNCLDFSLDVKPRARTLLRRLDFFTNQVHHFDIIDAHDRLQIDAHSRVETFPDIRDLNVHSDPQDLTELRASERFYDFMHSSHRISLGVIVMHELEEVLPRLDDVKVGATRLMEHIYSSFQYAPGSTHVETPVTAVFEKRKGVCQDFAHAMIALCRAAKIPARYVSGYFYTERPVTGTEDDNSASHAWVECFLPGIGWTGFDPTHNRLIDMTYIKLGHGRDYSDVRPVSGTFRGSARAEMQVDVQIEREE